MYESNLKKSISFWNKDDLIDLAAEYELYESERDMQNFSYALSFDELADFVVFLFCGDWSRNISILSEEEQKDERIQKLFEFVERIYTYK